MKVLPIKVKKNQTTQTYGRTNREKTRCVCATQMPPIMANSKYGQGQKDKYLDTNPKIFSQEMLMCNTKALIVSSAEPKASLIKFVRRCRRGCRKLLTFSSFLQNTGSISSKLGTKHPLEKGFKFIQMKGLTFFQGEIITK